MSSSFQKKSSQIFLTLFIGIIVISFMVSGPFFNTGTPDSIGSVAGKDIKVREFNSEVQRQSEFYSKFVAGGQPLTSKQMSQYKIYDNAIRNLVYQKLRIVLASDLGITVSKEEIVNDIKSATYFQTNNQFDINKYKGLLSYNKITPEDFEEETRDRLAATKLQNIMQHLPISSKFQEELNTIYNERRATKTAILDHSEVRKLLKVSNKDIKTFLADEKNTARVQSLFNQKVASLSTPEEVKTRHILLMTKDKNESEVLKKAQALRKKITKKNFISMAKKNTEEPQGQKNGGDLKWVRRGQMVPEFEKATFALKPGEISQPVKTSYGYHIIYVEKKKEAKIAKFEEHKNLIAKEILQQEKDLKPLLAKATKEIKAALSSKKALTKVEKKYNLKIEEKEMNKLDTASPTGGLDEKQVTEIFSKPSGTYEFNDANKTTFVLAQASKNKKSEVFDTKAITNISTQQTTKDLLDKLSKKYSFKQNKYAQLPQ